MNAARLMDEHHLATARVALVILTRETDPPPQPVGLVVSNHQRPRPNIAGGPQSRCAQDARNRLLKIDRSHPRSQFGVVVSGVEDQEVSSRDQRVHQARRGHHPATWSTFLGAGLDLSVIPNGLNAGVKKRGQASMATPDTAREDLDLSEPVVEIKARMRRYARVRAQPPSISRQVESPLVLPLSVVTPLLGNESDLDGFGCDQSTEDPASNAVEYGRHESHGEGVCLPGPGLRRGFVRIFTCLPPLNAGPEERANPAGGPALPTSAASSPVTEHTNHHASCRSKVARVAAGQQHRDLLQPVNVDPAEVAHEDEEPGVKGSRVGLEVVMHAFYVCGTYPKPLPNQSRLLAAHLWSAPDRRICTHPADHADGHVYHSTTVSDLGAGVHHGKDPDE